MTVTVMWFANNASTSSVNGTSQIRTSEFESGCVIYSMQSLARKRHALVAALSAAAQFGSSRMNIVSSVRSLGSSSIVDSLDAGSSGCGSGLLN